MKKMFLGICYLMISVWLPAQQLKGRITDAATGTPIASATVALSTIATTFTSESGQFSFSWLKPGNYILRISSIGYVTLEQTVSPGKEPVEFKLAPINLFLHPVEIRAIRAGERAPFTKINLYEKD